MDPHVVSFDAQHCLAIAAAFIAIIAACASLISGANSKAESLTNRIHEATNAFRRSKREGNVARCARIKEQVGKYGKRYETIQSAQLLLFLTIGVFIICLTAFIGLALYGSYAHIPDITVKPFASNLIAGIGFGVGLGTLSMLLAIGLHFAEVWRSHKTLEIEASDCHAVVESRSSADLPRPAVAAEPLGSNG